MSRIFDSEFPASRPGTFRMSEARLRAIEPELFSGRSFRCGPQCDKRHHAVEMRERIREHLEVGDSQPAVVVAINPVVVAVRSEDLDAAVLVRVPEGAIGSRSLHVGARLVSVNTYDDLRHRGTNEPAYATDLVPGPRRTNWSNFAPIIVDFVCDDAEAVQRRKLEIPEAEWRRLDENASARIERLGLSTARDGRPSRIAFPASIPGVPTFRTIAGIEVEPGRARSSRIILALGVLFLIWVLWTLIAADPSSLHRR